jgi:uncharacterized SAM-binding protein YcdF (DUF218 family)
MDRPAARQGVGRTICRLLGLGAIVVFALVAFTPISKLIARALSMPPIVAPADAVIVLAGGGVSRHGVLSSVSFRRSVHGIVLHREGWAPLLVLSGGESESRLRATLARRLKVPADAILTVAPGYTTREEAARIDRLLRPRGVRKILLVTDAPHMVRAKALFEQVGFEVLPAPALDGTGSAERPRGRLELFLGTLQELVALQYYRLAGFL